MDFPKSAFCNVHKIGISLVRWSAYGVDRGAQSTANPYGTLLEGPSIDSEKALDVLLAPERELRENGHHVYLDRREAILWVFDLSMLAVKRENNGEENAELVKILETYGCKRLSFGSLRASDLGTSSDLYNSCFPEDKTTSKVTKVFDSGAFHVNSVNAAKIETVTQGQNEQDNILGGTDRVPARSMIYERITNAVSMSILYALTKEVRCVPFNFDTFLLSTNTYFDNLHDLQQGLQSCTCMTAVSLFVQWQSTGTIVISSTPKQNFQWRNIADLFDHRCQALHVPTLDSLVLAPLGMSVRPILVKSHTSCSVTSDESDSCSDNQDSSRVPHLHQSQKWKASVRKLLESYGGVVPHHVRWLRVQALEYSKDFDEHSACMFVWPANLCFYCTNYSKTSKEDLSWAWDHGNRDVIDALTDAEHWFLGKSTRGDSSEAHKSQTELKTSFKSNALSSDDEDSGSDIFLTARRAIDEQALNGVYPTPPDGYRSSTTSALPAAEKDAIDCGYVKEPYSSASEERRHSEREVQLPHTSPEVDMSHGDFEHIEEDDLFGDMNTDMFTANGITEADFSFFDEPSVAKEISQADHHTLLNDQKYLSRIPQSHSDLNIRRPSTEDINMLSEVSDAEESPDASMTDRLEELNDTAAIAVESRLAGVLSPPDSLEASFNQITSTGNPADQSVPYVSNQHPIADRSNWNWPRPQHQLTQYGRLSFEGQSTAFDEKYITKGRFGDDNISERAGKEPFQTEKRLPTLGILARHETEVDLEDPNDAEDASDQLSLPEIGSRLLLEEPLNQLGIDDSIGLKRKRESSEVGGSNPVDSRHLVEHIAAGDRNSQETETIYLNQLIATSLDESFSSPKNILQYTKTPSHYIYPDNAQSFIQLAQIVSEQLAAEIQSQSEHSLDNKQKSSRYNDPLRHVLPTIFPSSERCDFDSYASFVYTTGSKLLPKVTSRPFQGKQDKLQGQGKASRLIFEISCPNVLARRGDTLMELSAAALPFWEELGLGPCAGPKDVGALCIFPESQMLRRGVRAFLRSMSSTYQSLRLGSHASFDKIGTFSEGLISFPLVESNVEEYIRCVDQLCEELGRMLARASDIDKPIIVYMVNPFADPSILPLLCNSYVKMLATYASKVGGHTYSYVYDLVLRVIPITMVASKTTIPIPSPQIYVQLARETYERCFSQSSEQHDSPAPFSSIFQLARTVPKTVNFGLTSDPLKALVGEDTSYHVAYSWCFDEQWLSVLLTDTQGDLCWKSSYCLDACPSWATFQETAKDIWDRILDTVKIRSAASRLILAKDQVMSSTELDIWIGLAASAGTIQINLIIVAVDLTPSLFFTGFPVTNLQSTSDAGSCLTPATTPLANAYDVGSPAMNSNWASTPKMAETFEIDPTARLVDKLDETWGIITAYSLNGDGSSPTLAEGYLVKRTGVRDDDGMDIIGVQVMHAEKMGERVLSDILIMYRALATIGRAKGIMDGCKSVLPWHLAVVTKIRKGLNLLMPWGR